VPESAGCGERRPVIVRKVFVANGDLGRLLEKYLREAEARSVPVDAERLEILYVGADREQHVVNAPRRTLLQTLEGWSEKDLWLRLLAGKAAAPRNNAPADAETLGADVVCGD
jgi:hypothetical protein